MMNLAGLLADPEEVTKEQLDAWVRAANQDMLSERCVAVLAEKTSFGFEIARKWIQSDEEFVMRNNQ